MRHLPLKKSQVLAAAVAVGILLVLSSGLVTSDDSGRGEPSELPSSSEQEATSAEEPLQPAPEATGRSAASPTESEDPVNLTEIQDLPAEDAPQPVASGITDGPAAYPTESQDLAEQTQIQEPGSSVAEGGNQPVPETAVYPTENTPAP